MELFERNTYSVVNIFDVSLRPQVNMTGSVEVTLYPDLFVSRQFWFLFSNVIRHIVPHCSCLTLFVRLMRLLSSNSTKLLVWSSLFCIQHLLSSMSFPVHA